MDFPAGLTLVTVTGSLSPPADPGLDRAGVKFRSRTMLITPTGAIVPPFAVDAVLDVHGDFTVQLPACDDPDVEPEQWSYAVTIYAGQGVATGALHVPISAAAEGIELGNFLTFDATSDSGTITYLRASSRGVANGVAALDGTGKVPSAQLPASAGGDPAWDDITGKPATFPPSAHTHTIANVTGLQAALDTKQASGSYATTSALATTNGNVTALSARVDDTEDDIIALEGRALVLVLDAVTVVPGGTPAGTVIVRTA